MMIQDGTGDAKFAQVNARKHLVTTAIQMEDGTFVSLDSSDAYFVDTGLLTIPGTFSGPILLLENLDGNRDMIVAAAFTIDAVSAGATISLLRNPVLAALAANASRTPLNLNFESGKNPSSRTEIWDNATGLVGMTGITAVIDGTFGPFPVGTPFIRSSTFVLGQNDVCVIEMAAGATGYEANASFRFYFDTTGAK